MAARITHDPGTTAAGQIRKYGVEVVDGDWPAFAELVEELVGCRVSVTTGDMLLTFETVREKVPLP